MNINLANISNEEQLWQLSPQEIDKVRAHMLSTLDLRLARLFSPTDMQGRPSRDSELLIGLHKARVEVVTQPAHLRLESIEWLRTNGFNRYKNLPLPSPGELPT